MSATPEKLAALVVVAERQQALDLLEAQATKAANMRSAAMLAAQVSGATYVVLVDATGLSKVRVGQVLTNQRNQS